MSELYMIRHGQASFGSSTYDRLSAQGLVQAEILAEHLLSSGLRFDAIYTGAMERQQKTAAALISAHRARRLAPPLLVEDAALNEYDSEAVLKHHLPAMAAADPSLAAALETLYSDPHTFQRLFQQAMTRWASGKFDSRESPSWQAFRNRVHRAIREIMRQQGSKKTLALFSSGGPIAVTVQMALDLSDAKTMALSWQILNASVTRFKYNAAGIALAGFNDISHLRLRGNAALLTYR